MHRTLTPSITDPRLERLPRARATMASPSRIGARRALIAVIALASCAGVAVAQAITPINLGTLGGNFSRAYDINDAGAVVGFSANPNAPFSTAFVWTASTGITAMPVTSPGPGFIRPDSAYAINASGQIALTAGGAYRYSGSTYTPLGILNPIQNRTTPYAINAHGDIVGTADDASGSTASYVGVLYRAGVLSHAGTLREARDINDNGLVAGSGGTINRAMIWDSVTGTTTNLGTLGGNTSFATGVNNHGGVVGFSGVPTGGDNAFLWTAAGGMVALATPTGGTSSFAFDINDAGEIVGSASIAGSSRAVYWHNNTAIDLNTLLAPGSGWVLQGATAINNSGCITGAGSYFGEERAFVLCIPSPGALPLHWLGALGALRRRRPPSAS